MAIKIYKEKMKYLDKSKQLLPGKLNLLQMQSPIHVNVVSIIAQPLTMTKECRHMK